MIMKLSQLNDAPCIDAILSKRNINGFEALGGTDKQTIHSYGPVYEQLLRPLTDINCTILEVGIQLGGSMLLWHDLLPNSFVIGVDIEKAYDISIPERMETDRYKFFIENAYCLETIDKIKAIAKDGIDVAIDDGPHTLESKEQFLELYLPLLKKGGVAIIEDIQDPSWMPRLLDRVPSGMRAEEVDIRSKKGRYDDLMLVVFNG
jgi:hypothetical protein